VRWPWAPRRDREADLRAEIGNHLDLDTEDGVREGLTEAQARREARLAFGHPLNATDDTRETWGWMWLERLLIDARHAVRLWSRHPGFSLVAVMTIALGIGASTAIVGQINGVFWTPLPVAQPQGLQLVAWTAARHPYVAGSNVLAGPTVDGTQTLGSFSGHAYRAMREGSRTFSDVACWADLGEARPVTLGELGFGAVQFVSGNYFRMLGVPAHLGRTLQPDDDRPEAWSEVAMISHRFWLRTFGGDRDVTQRQVRLNGRWFSVIGVTPPGFYGLDSAVSPDVFIPLGAIVIAAANANPLQTRFLWNPCRVAGRLAAGVPDEEGRAELERLVRQSIDEAPPPQAFDYPRIHLADGSRGMTTLRDASAAPLLIIFGVVGGLLLAACANIAGLLLARGGAREKEIATRLALGAPRSRIVRQLMTESLILSLAGGALGVALSYALSGVAAGLLGQLMPTLYGSDRTISVATGPDLRVLAFAAAASLGAGLLFGTLPALSATRLNLITVIRQSSSAAGRRVWPVSGGQAMVAAQTALAIVLLVGAGLFLQTMTNLRGADLGIDVAQVLYARVEPRSGGLKPEQRMPYFEQAVKRLETMPGVQYASAVAFAPIGGESQVTLTSAQVVCAPPGSASREPFTSEINAVAPRYFESMGIPHVAGRDVTWTDHHVNAGPVFIVNQAFARAYFGGADPLGRGVAFTGNCAREYPVIGVVADSRTGLREGPAPTIYMQLGSFGGPVTLVARTAGDPSAMIAAVRRAIREVNADIPTFSEAALTDLRERHLRRERLLSDLLALFGSVTLLICCLGIYGLLSYSVSRRRAEISVRMAIGARTPDVVRMVVQESLLPVVLGIVMGCAAAVAATRWIDSQLFGISGHDPLTLAAASLLFVMVAAAAAALPARAASRVDPVLALRQQ
jgi:predicted permease